jgi:hypothetical protein
MAGAAGEVEYEARNTGQLGVGGCLGIWMYVVFGGMPLALIAMTWQDLAEAPVWLPVFWLVSFFPLAMLLVLRRLMARHALRIGRAGWVEIVLPFKTIRLAPGELAAVKAASVTAATPGTAPIRRAYAYFLAPDRSVKATVAMAAFGQDQWAAFFDALARVRPDVEIG